MLNFCGRLAAKNKRTYASGIKRISTNFSSPKKFDYNKCVELIKS